MEILISGKWLLLLCTFSHPPNSHLTCLSPFLPSPTPSFSFYFYFLFSKKEKTYFFSFIIYLFTYIFFWENCRISPYRMAKLRVLFLPLRRGSDWHILRIYWDTSIYKQLKQIILKVQLFNAYIEVCQ